MKKVLRITSEWRADTEKEVEAILDEATSDGGELTKKTIEIKSKKSRGEIIDECYKVTTQVTYTDLWSDDDDEEESPKK